MCPFDDTKVVHTSSRNSPSRSGLMMRWHFSIGIGLVGVLVSDVSEIVINRRR